MVTTVGSLVSSFVIVNKTLLSDTSSMVISGDGGFAVAFIANKIRSCPLPGPGCPGSTPTMLKSPCTQPDSRSKAPSRRSASAARFPLFFMA